MVADFSEKCFQVLRDYLIEDCLLGLVAMVTQPGANASAQGDPSVRGTSGIRGFSGSTTQGFGDHSELCAESNFVQIGGVADSCKGGERRRFARVEHAPPRRFVLVESRCSTTAKLPATVVVAQRR
jgi:hypothetical protein